MIWMWGEWLNFDVGGQGSGHLWFVALQWKLDEQLKVISSDCGTNVGDEQFLCRGQRSKSSWAIDQILALRP